MKNDIAVYVSKWDKCHRQSNKVTPKMSSLHPEAVPLGCWHQVGMGLVGPLSETERGHEYIFFPDYFSKCPTAVPLKIKSAYEVANVLTGVICSYGCCKTLTTNQGREFKTR